MEKIVDKISVNIEIRRVTLDAMEETSNRLISASSLKDLINIKKALDSNQAYYDELQKEAKVLHEERSRLHSEFDKL